MQQWASARVFPKQEHVFRALNAVPVADVRVVILGQVCLLVQCRTCMKLSFEGMRMRSIRITAP